MTKEVVLYGPIPEGKSVPREAQLSDYALTQQTRVSKMFPILIEFHHALYGIPHDSGETAQQQIFPPALHVTSLDDARPVTTNYTEVTTGRPQPEIVLQPPVKAINMGNDQQSNFPDWSQIGCVNFLLLEV